MKVGRAALDEDAIRLIEELNPFVEFDWPRIIKGQDAPPSEPRVPVEVRRQRDRGASRSSERPAPRETPARTERPRTEIADVTEALETASRPPAPEPPAPDVIVAAHARLGAEGVARLRVRYNEIVARIAERVPDPAKREELQTQAVRLSPDSWITDDDVARALDAYESVFASLREVVGRKRRRRRRGSRSSGSSEDRETAGSETQGIGSSEDRELGATEEDGQTDGALDSSDTREEPDDPGL